MWHKTDAVDLRAVILHDSLSVAGMGWGVYHAGECEQGHRAGAASLTETCLEPGCGGQCPPACRARSLPSVKSDCLLATGNLSS